MKNECLVLYSGGTDSTCAAALCAEKHSRVHLITMYERATKHSPLPIENIQRLKNKYGSEKFLHRKISTDRLVKKISYENYFQRFWQFGFFLLSTPGFSSLSWHLRAIQYCRENQINHVYDGMTRELLHFPGHMPQVRELFKNLYASFGIAFSSPVIDWEVPPDQRLVDRLIVDRHGFVASPEAQPQVRTTGLWLFEQGIFPHPNVKGSLFDHRMQHDCYPFVVYNIFAFWLMPAFMSWEKFENKMQNFFSKKVQTTQAWLHDAKFLQLFEPVEMTE